jgi:hypothetical protein
MIVDAFKDTLELGLEKPKQVVVRFLYYLVLGPQTPIREWGGDTYWMERGISPMRPLRAPLFPLRGMYD